MTKDTQEVQVESLADRLARLIKEHGLPQLRPAGELFGVPEQLKDEIIQARNQRAIKLLEEWYATPDDLGDEWWDEFEQDLKRNRFSFRKAAD